MSQGEIIVLESVVVWPKGRAARSRRTTDEARIAGVVYFPLGVFFLAVGGSFWQTSCSDVAAIYLVVHGSLMVANFFLLVFLPTSLLLAIIGIANLGVWLWGSVAVFSYHHGLARSSDIHFGTNCSQFPFWVSFVFLLYTWAITLLLALSVFAMCLMFTFYRPDAGLEHQDPEKNGHLSEDEDDSKTEHD